jgi:hypothetical protein
MSGGLATVNIFANVEILVHAVDGQTHAFARQMGQVKGGSGAAAD